MKKNYQAKISLGIKFALQIHLILSLILISFWSNAQSVTISNGTLVAGSTVGMPIYRPSTNSTVIYAKSVQLITAAQLESEGLPNGALINEWGYKKINNSVPAGSNSWNLKVYLKNSTATALVSGTTWANMLSGATLVYNITINSTTMPATSGYWMWNLSSPFQYTGNAIETYIEWTPIGTLNSPYSTGIFSFEYGTATTARSMGMVGITAISLGYSSWGVSQNAYNAKISYSAPNCNGSPTGGIISGNPASVCISQSFTLRTSGGSPQNNGIGYQWESADDMNFTTNVNVIGTGATVTVNQSAPKYYRRLSNCSFSGLNNYSNTVYVNMSDYMQCYCSSTHTQGCSGDAITNLTLNGWTNYTGTTCPPPPAYTYFNPLVSQTSLTMGSTYALTLSLGSHNSQFCGAWIDYNRDGILSPSENIGLTGNAGAYGNVTINFTVPTNASAGITRLRVIGGDDIPLTVNHVCGISADTWGETEDYDITIIDPCPSSVPNVGNTIASATSVCSGGAVSFSLQNSAGNYGISYQWQSADDASFTNGLINLGTASTQTMTFITNKYVRCLVTLTCQATQPSTTSNPILITVLPPALGSSSANPIVVGQAPCNTQPYIHTQNNSITHCFTNNIGQSSNDVYYQFTLASPSTIHVGHCSSPFDTYIHLLDQSLNVIASNNNNGPLCATNTASIILNLAAGTYYVVSEGNGSNSGNITTTINTTNSCDAAITVKCFIQGFYEGTSSMKSVLANQGLSNPVTDCDAITVELHQSTAPYSMLHSYSGMLQTDGTITCNFPNSTIGENYYIVLKHRNTLETWSATPVAIQSITSYDFSTSATKAYGNNQVMMSSNVYAMYSGELNNDKNIDLLDSGILEIDINNFSFGHFATDINGDGNVDLLDTGALENNINEFIFAEHP